MTNNEFENRIRTLMAQKGEQNYLLEEAFPTIMPGVYFATAKEQIRFDIYFDPSRVKQVKGQSITSYHDASNPGFVMKGNLAGEVAEGVEGLVGFIDGTGMTPGLTDMLQAVRFTKKLLVKRN
jgi:hypothetical protein